VVVIEARPNGLIVGSACSERWLLWPKGVSSAGAMRERGRQAAAFVVYRHFDDMNLLDDLFKSISELDPFSFLKIT